MSFFRPDVDDLISVAIEHVERHRNNKIDVVFFDNEFRQDCTPAELADLFQEDIQTVIFIDGRETRRPEVLTKYTRSSDNDQFHIVERDNNYQPIEYFQDYK